MACAVDRSAESAGSRAIVLIADPAKGPHQFLRRTDIIGQTVITEIDNALIGGTIGVNGFKFLHSLNHFGDKNGGGINRDVLAIFLGFDYEFTFPGDLFRIEFYYINRAGVFPKGHATASDGRDGILIKSCFF